MPTRAITGWGGSLKLTVGSAEKTIPVRNVTIERQASEFDMTSLSDTKMFAGPGRVKRTGSFEAYVSSETGGIITAIETINSNSLTTPAQLVFTDSASTATTLSVIITGANQTHSNEDAAIFSVTFSETISATLPSTP
jgi:hypothetical protein